MFMISTPFPPVRTEGFRKMWLWGKKCREKREKSPLILPDRFVFLRCQKVVNCGFFLPQIRTQSPYIFDRKKACSRHFLLFFRSFMGKAEMFDFPCPPHQATSIPLATFHFPTAREKKKNPFYSILQFQSVSMSGKGMC